MMIGKQINATAGRIVARICPQQRPRNSNLGRMRFLIIVASSAVAIPVSLGQGVGTAAAPSNSVLYRVVTQIPPMLVPPFLVLGDRVTKPGNERITLQGTLTTTAGAAGVQIVLELGGKLSITWSSPGSQKLVFDGKSASIPGGVQNGNDLLESFVDDLVETLMISGPSPRLLGQRFANPAGGSCDYYDVASDGKAVKKANPVVKRYCFDSTTLFLSSVRYKNTSSQMIVTQFGNWARVNNEAVPGGVTRIVGGTQIFSFQAQAAVVSASVPDNTFSP